MCLINQLVSMSRGSTTLWSPGDTVKDAAEVLGVANLPEDVAKVLAMDVEYRLKEIIEQAMKFMRHSKRKTLNTKDIAGALKVLNIEPLYGYDTGRALSYREAVTGANQTLYYVDEEEEVDFDKLINEPIPKVPREPTFTAHWLAIEGVQPSIPQNPHSSEIKALPPLLRGSQVFNSTAALTQDVDVKPLVKHMISKELQLYFDRVIRALVDDMAVETGDRQTALFSLRSDPGLHQLTPYFIQFAQEKISDALKSNLRVVSTMLEVLDSLLANPTIFVEPYIHQIVPCVLTVLVARRLGETDPEGAEGYTARTFAAALLQQLCDQYGATYPTLRSRLTRTLLKGFMDVRRPLPSLYGIVLGIEALGSEVIRVIILGNLRVWFDAAPHEPEMQWNNLLYALERTLSHLDAPPNAEFDEAQVKERYGENAGDFLIERGLAAAAMA